MAQHPSDGPVLVRRSRKSVLVHPLDEGTEPPTLARVHLGVATTPRHRLPPTHPRSTGAANAGAARSVCNHLAFPTCRLVKQGAFGANVRGMSPTRGAEEP